IDYDPADAGLKLLRRLEPNIMLAAGQSRRPKPINHALLHGRRVVPLAEPAHMRLGSARSTVFGCPAAPIGLRVDEGQDATVPAHDCSNTPRSEAERPLRKQAPIASESPETCPTSSLMAK